MKDYSGLTCGCWKVIERDFYPKSKSHETFWKAKCLNCGTIASVRKSDLDKERQCCNNCKGQVISAKMIDRNNKGEGNRSWSVGDRYGFLTIIDRGKPQGKHTYVKVQCDCGSSPFEVRLAHLRGQNHSKTISCGCATKSSGEIKIEQILKDNNIDFVSQYREVDKNGKVMFFDFAIIKNNKIVYVIEYNGPQHYEPVEFFGGEDVFKNQQERDARKTAYCQAHGIKLKWIPYYDFDKIDTRYLELEKFLV